jgi:hypothetical protein
MKDINSFQKMVIMKRSVFVLIALLGLSTTTFSQDKKFYIFLCFGQSNMEGNARIEAQDSVVDSRFQVMETLLPKSGQREREVVYSSSAFVQMPHGSYSGRLFWKNIS